MAFKFEETEKLYKNLKQLSDTVLQFDKEFLDAEMEEVIINTKMNTPVDTGLLKKSWLATPSVRAGNSVESTILNNARNTDDYATHVEYGHLTVNGGWVQGRFMMTRAIRVYETNVIGRYENKFLNLLRKVNLL